MAERLKIHYTPKHGSFLDLAETDLSVLSRQCLNRRTDNVDDLIREIRAWEKQRNEAECKIEWRFTTDDARIKLKQLLADIGDD